MKRLALLTLLLIPLAVHAVSQMPPPYPVAPPAPPAPPAPVATVAVAPEACVEAVAGETECPAAGDNADQPAVPEFAPPTPPEPPTAPWARPPGDDEASSRFRYGEGGRHRSLPRVVRAIINPHRAIRMLPTTNPTAFKEVKGDLAATPERARRSALGKLEREVTQWARPQVPGNWQVPANLVEGLVVQTQIAPTTKPYGTLYQATLRCDFSPARRLQVVRAYESGVVAKRLGVLGIVLAFVLACLAALAGYIRADEATKGYYTNQLRLATAAGVGAAGVVAYRLLA
jgi:hypothetical protein